MRILRKTYLSGSFLFLIYTLISCSASSKKSDQLLGKYSSVGESDYYKTIDTIEIRATDDGKFDIQTLSYWSTPKTDDPEVIGKGKKAGVWTNYGQKEVEVATFQESDNTLRVPVPMSSAVTIIKVDFHKQTIQKETKYGGTVIYHKIEGQNKK